MKTMIKAMREDVIPLCSSIIHLYFQCRTTYAGNGHFCAQDFDLDGYADVELNCSDKECRKV